MSTVSCAESLDKLRRGEEDRFVRIAFGDGGAEMQTLALISRGQADHTSIMLSRLSARISLFSIFFCPQQILL